MLDEMSDAFAPALRFVITYLNKQLSATAVPIVVRHYTGRTA